MGSLNGCPSAGLEKRKTDGSEQRAALPPTDRDPYPRSLSQSAST